MIEKNNLLPQIEDETIIWRYMDFATFYALLMNKALFFRRLDKQTDKLEGTLNETIIDDFYKAWKLQGFSDFDCEKRSIKQYGNILNYRPFTLANSWTMADDEDYALWKIYLRGSREGVAIKTTIKRLKASLGSNDCHINLAKVNYDYLLLKMQDLNQHNVSTYKRKSYKYEKELRVYILHQFRNGINERGVQDRIPLFDVGKNVEVDLSLLFDEIFVSPFSGSWFKEIVESTVDNLLGNGNVKIYNSEINDT